MAAVQFDTAEAQMMAAFDTALDIIFAGGAENPPSTQVLPPLQGYSKSADVQGKDYRPQIRDALRILLAGAMTTPPPWTGIAYANAWADAGGSSQVGGYYKDLLGNAHLRGTITGGTGDITTLPAGMCPPADIAFIVPGVAVGGALIPVMVTITAAGVVTPANAGALPLVAVTSLSLDGIHFATA